MSKLNRKLKSKTKSNVQIKKLKKDAGISSDISYQLNLYPAPCTLHVLFLHHLKMEMVFAKLSLSIDQASFRHQLL